MRHANLILIALVVLNCRRPPEEQSPWALARKGVRHIQADLTSSLDRALVPPEGNAAPPQRSTARIGGIGRSGIYMQAPCRARFPVFVHSGGLLVAWPALMPAAWVGSTDGAEFRVSVVRGGQDSVFLGSVVLNPRVRESDRRWARVEYPLQPWAGSKVEIELAVDPGQAGDTYQDWCFWGEPVVCAPPLVPPHRSPRDLDRAIEEGVVQVDWDFTEARGAAVSPGGSPPQTSAFALADVRREGLYAHPPWAIASTVVPGPRARFTTSLGMVESCQDQSDGVMIRVVAQAVGDVPMTLFEYWLSPRANLCDRRWIDIEVPLIDYAFRPVTITVETSAGPLDNYDYDSVTLGSPRIVSFP